jgi:hypothetical protein
MKPSTTIKILLLVLLTATITTTYAQTVINNRLTDKHMYVPGTKLSLIPPYLFEPAKAFKGFDFTEGGRIEVITTDSVYLPIADSAHRYRLSNGVLMVVDTVDTCVVNGLKAVYMSGSYILRNYKFQTYVLGLVTDSGTVVIEGDCTSDELLNGMVRKGVLSAVYDSTLAVQPFNPLNYSVDITGTDFVFLRRGGGEYFYVSKADVPVYEKQWPQHIILVSAQPLPPLGYNEKNEVAGLLKWLAKPDAPLSMEPVTINGLHGYMCSTVSNNMPKFIHSVVLFADRVYMMLGMANDEAHLAALKKVFTTFKLK